MPLTAPARTSGSVFVRAASAPCAAARSERCSRIHVNSHMVNLFRSPPWHDDTTM
jgi:hypothetical protein